MGYIFRDLYMMLCHLNLPGTSALFTRYPGYALIA
jgi:hypothetical protein